MPTKKVLLLFTGISVIVAVIVWFILYSQKPVILPRTDSGNIVDLSIYKPYGNVTAPDNKSQ
jgi:hypothetical protein